MIVEDLRLACPAPVDSMECVNSFLTLSSHHYTVSHLENDRDVSSYILDEAAGYPTCNLCVFSHVLKGIPGLTRKRTGLKVFTHKALAESRSATLQCVGG